MKRIKQLIKNVLWLTKNDLTGQETKVYTIDGDKLRLWYNRSKGGSGGRIFQ